MKLNLTDGVKIEVKRSELVECAKSFKYIMSSDEELEQLGVELVTAALPADQSVGIVFKNDVNAEDPILMFLKLAKDPNDNVEIPRENWIIDED